MGQKAKNSGAKSKEQARHRVMEAYASLPKARKELRITCHTENGTFIVTFGLAGRSRAYIHQDGPGDQLDLSVGPQSEAVQLFQTALDYLTLCHFFVSSDLHSRQRFGTDPEVRSIPGATWSALGVKITYDEERALNPRPSSHARET